MTVNFINPEPFAQKVKGVACNTKTSYLLACRHYVTQASHGNEYLFMTRGGNFWILTPARAAFVIGPYEAACYRAGLFVPFFMNPTDCARLSCPYGEGALIKVWADAPVPELRSAAAKKAVEFHSLPLPECVKERVERFEKTGKLDKDYVRSIFLAVESMGLASRGLRR